MGDLTNLSDIVQHLMYVVPGGYSKLLTIAIDAHIRGVIPPQQADGTVGTYSLVAENLKQRDLAAAWCVALGQAVDDRGLLAYPLFRTFADAKSTDELKEHLDASEGVIFSLAEEAMSTDGNLLSQLDIEYLFWHLKEIFPEQRLFMLWPPPYEVYKEIEVTSRIDRRSIPVSGEAARLARILLENRGEYVSLSGLEIAAPSREVKKLKKVFSELPEMLWPRIDQDSGKGYRLMS